MIEALRNVPVRNIPSRARDLRGIATLPLVARNDNRGAEVLATDVHTH